MIDLQGPGEPFVDEKTRALSFSFNLLNGNDMAMPPVHGIDLFGFRIFDGFDPYASERGAGSAHVLSAQITFVLDATGHWERVHRIYAMAPMHEYFFGTDGLFWAWIVLWIWILILDFNRFYKVSGCMKIDELCMKIDEPCIEMMYFVFNMIILMQISRRVSIYSSRRGSIQVKMMHFAFKTSGSVSKTRNCVPKTRSCVFKRGAISIQLGTNSISGCTCWCSSCSTKRMTCTHSRLRLCTS